MLQPLCRYGTRLKSKEAPGAVDTLPQSFTIAIIHPSGLHEWLL
jgi:hypothetical protein